MDTIKIILAGGLSGAIEICISYPIEFIKTQLQLQDKKNPHFHGSLDVIKKTMKHRGYFGLYTGLPVLLAFSIPKVSVRFLSFDQSKKLMAKDNQKLTAIQTMIAGSISGITEAMLVNVPMETIKVKFVMDQRKETPRFKGLIHGVQTILKEEKFKGIYKGLTPTVLKAASNQAMRFLLFEKILNFISPGEKKTIPMLTAGAITGIVSVLVNTPVDVMKTRMQGLNSKSTMDCIKDIYKHNGFRGFYKGIGMRMIRSCSDVAFSMTLYHQLIKLFNS